VRVWREYLVDNILRTDGSVILDDDQEYADILNTPTVSDVVGICRELYKEDAEFRRLVKEKWGGDIKQDDSDDEGEEQSSGLSRPDRPKRRKKKGQMTLGDVT